MSERQTVSVVGLGDMGSALARAISAAGHELTVWNRSTAKSAEFAEQGVAVADSIGDAIAGSEVIVVCLRGYDVAQTLLSEAAEVASLEGKVLIQLGTGVPREVTEAASWSEDQGVAYLDGSIMAFPDAVGTGDCQILVSGDPQTFERGKAVLSTLGGDVRFVGPDPTASAVINTGSLGFVYVAAHAFINAAAMCYSAGAPLELLSDVVGNLTGQMPALFDDFAAMIEKERYDSSSLRLASGVDNLRAIVEFGGSNGVDTDLFESALRTMAASAEAGHGSNLAAVFELVRR